MRPEQEKAMHEQLAAAKEAGIGAAGMAPSLDSCLNQASTQSPRDRMCQRINWRVDELLAQVAQLREAERILKYANSETLRILDKLEGGGFNR